MMSLSFEDHFNAVHEISKIIYGYADALDTGDFERLGEYFVRSTLRINGREEVYEGREGVLGMFYDYTRFYDGIPSTKHVTTNLLIDVNDSGESATAKSYFTVLQARPELPLQVVIAGRYADTFERMEGTWYLTDRFEYCDLIGDLSAHIAGNPLSI
jgi:3-phenylpropionate/cinnamic acid dioxygenase small subunit